MLHFVRIKVREFGLIRSLIKHRKFVFSFISNDFKSRYSISKLGLAWTVLTPLAQVCVYTLILSRVMQLKLPGLTSHYAFAIYLISGLLAWNLFSDCLSRITSMFIENRNLILKSNIPKFALPIVISGSSTLTFFFLFASALFVFFVLGHSISLEILWVLPALVVLISFAVALGSILAIFSVFVRDIFHFLPILLQLWFWLTPIVYPLEILPSAAQKFIGANPLLPIVQTFHAALVYKQHPPSLNGLFIVMFLSLMLAFLCMSIFRKAQHEIMDEL